MSRLIKVQHRYSDANVDRHRSSASLLNHWKRALLWILRGVVLWIVAAPGNGFAQNVSQMAVADTSSPRDTLRSFLDAANEIYAIVRSDQFLDRNNPDHIALSRKFLDCIDDSELPAFARKDRAAEVAVCLKEILDRINLPPWEEVPDVEQIQAAGGLESLAGYRLPDTRITIARVEDGPRRHEYLFSPGTVDRAVEYYRTVAARPYRSGGEPVSEDFYRWFLSAPGHPTLVAIVKHLPDDIRLRKSWGVTNWKWPGLMLTIVVASFLMLSLYRAHSKLSKNVADDQLLKYWLILALPVAAIFVPLAVKFIASRYLTLRSWPLYITDFTSIFAALLATMVVIFAASNRIAATIISSPHVNPAGLNAQLIRIICRLASFVAVIALFLIGGQYLGIPVATLLASAGIGGVAVALAAQDTLKTLFGTVNLLSDKPFLVGDRIIFKNYDGFVEDIGVRSTSLRLLTGHQVTLPNDQLSGNDIENVGRRPYIRRSATIHIPLDTSYDRVAKAVEIIREELADHEGMEPELPPRVFFDDFTATAFRIQFLYWYHPADYWKFKAFGERLNFEIFRKFEAHGIQFSLPARHTFWKNDNEKGPLDIAVIKPDEGSAATDLDGRE